MTTDDSPEVLTPQSLMSSKRKTDRSFFQVFQSRKMVAMLLLGFGSGLPLYLTSRTLQAWMTVEGVDLGSIGLFSLVALPYSLKFLWSPFLDRYIPPFLDRRRGWLAITQIGLVVAIAAMSLQQPKEALQLLAINAFIIAFLSASQDIAYNAYQIEILKKRQLGIGVAIGVLGYRIALLVAGALALILADQMSWPQVYLGLAGLMAINILFTLWSPKPSKSYPPVSLNDALVLPFQEFFQRLGITKGFLILMFIVLYKLGDAFINNMVTPFLLQTGFTQTDIGAVQGGMGLLATIVGALVGGLIIYALDKDKSVNVAARGKTLSPLGINRSLWIFGILQALSNLVYFILAQLGQNYPFMVLAINIENFCGGLGTTAFTAFIFSLCNKNFSATQVALLTSLMAVSRDILVAPAGELAKRTGWPSFFLFTLVAALPGLFLLPWFAPWTPPSDNDQSEVS